MLVISESLGGFFPLGLGNPAFVFAVGFKRRPEELRGHGSNFAVGLGQRLGGPMSRESSRSLVPALCRREKHIHT